ncbi:hypothetical protein [Nonomuraea sp. NPDC049709]|uniref:hypothetical protein n=1 Tax=Nonomuraea sp. NPDC049709 TaxID=3154736 RepID=UPI00341621E7
MTWLRDVLDDLADESPRVDLAAQTIRIRQRRRRAAASVMATVAVVVTALAATTAVRLLQTEPDPATETGKVTDLPARGVGPLSHAYKTFCRPHGGTAPQDCRDGAWRVVLRDGRTYHVPQALPSRSHYRGEPRLDSPLAISQDGTKIAYYSAEAGTFAVRDLASGEVMTAPAKVPEKVLRSLSNLLLSGDGRFLAFTKTPPLKDSSLLFDLRKQLVRPLPRGWIPLGLSMDGNSITLAQSHPKSRLRTMTRLWETPTATDGKTVNLPPGYSASPLAPDGRTIVAADYVLSRATPCGQPGKVVRLDAETGKGRKAIDTRGLPIRDHSVRLDAWLSSDEMAVITKPSQCTPLHLPARADPPYVTFTAYALNITTGNTRKVGTYSVQTGAELVLPGFRAAL